MPDIPSHLSLFLEQRPGLLALAYKMTKNISDAEDILSDVYIAFSRQAFDLIREPERYLVRSVIHACFALLDKKKSTAYIGIDLPEPIVHERFPFLVNKDVSYALLVLLQKLNAMERAVFLLRESFDYSYKEIALLTGASEANCRQLLHRATEKLKAVRIKYAPSGSEKEEITKAFLMACASGDTRLLEKYLAEEIIIQVDGGGKVPAIRKPVIDKDSAIKYLAGTALKFGKDLSCILTPVNMEIGVLLRHTLTARLDSVMIPVFQNDQISELFIIRNPDKMKHLV